MPATIRKATTDDSAQIAGILGEVIAEPNPVAFSEPLPPALVEAWIDRQGENGALFVIDDGRHVLTFASLDFDSSRPDECNFGAWVRTRNRRQGHGTALAEEAPVFAHERGYRHIRARLPEDNEPALSFLSSIGAMVSLTNPGASFGLPIYEQHE